MKLKYSILQANYKKQTVFYTAITDSLANRAFGVVLWNCESEVISVFNHDEQDEFLDLVSDKTVLYRCKRAS